MRLAKLELLAYGHFRGTALDFGAPGLHVVLGRNEAGKSTTLRAITGLFYGIDRATPDAHVHKPTELRIGGVLESQDGQKLRVVRRKGNTSTLLDPQDKPIDEAVLRRFLGGVTRETFEHAYGLDHDTLAEGAKALLEGRGDLGESLFDAGVGGGGGVQQLVARLAAEADAIFKPKASTPMLNEALKQYEQAAKRIKETQSLPEAFTRQEVALAEEIARRDDATAKKKDLEQRKSRIVRASKRAPRERERAHLLELRAELGAVVQSVGRIETLQQRFAAYERDVDQLRGHRAEVERLVDRLADAMRRAEVAASTSLDALREHARSEERVKPLLKERTRLTERVAAADHEIARAERALERLVGAAANGAVASAANAAAPLLSSVAERDALAAAIERARALGAGEDRLATETARLERARAALVTRGRALFAGDIDALVALRPPSLASVQALEARAAELTRRATRAAERTTELEREGAALEKDAASRAGAFAPPDASVLHAARALRDDAWRAVRAADPKARAEAELTLERLLRDADVVADRMIAEADRVTALARLRAEIDGNRAQLGKVAAECTQIAAARATLEAEASSLFAAAGIPPCLIAEMAGWLSRHAQLVEEHARVAEDTATLSLERDRAARIGADLCAALGLEPGASRLADLITTASARLEALDDARRTAAEAARATAQQRAALDDRVAARARDAALLAEVTAKVAELVKPLGLDASASDDDVNRTLTSLREVFERADKRAEADARTKVMEGGILEFEQDLRAAVAAIDPMLDAADTRVVARDLFEKCRRAKDVGEKLTRVEEVLAEIGEPGPLEEADRALVADPDASELAQQQLGESIDELERDVTQSTERIGGIRTGLDQMRKESNAAEAAAVAQHHLARVREGAERWARVKLASVILAREIERYREENQGPLLASSSSLFARLTLGAYAGIKAGFDEKDRPCLRCVRKNGVEVDVTGLSDGTRDQLYLSLRLASLLRRAEVAEPMPLILDDVLIQLDDQRAAAALTVLAEVARTMQILFFTHHARLVDLAREAVPAADLVIHTLTSPAAPTTSASA